VSRSRRLALLTDAGCLLGDCAQRLCLRTTKRYPASFGGRQGSHSALRDKPVLVVHGLPRARGRSQGCRAKFDRHSLAGALASHYPKQTALARSRLYRLLEWSAGVTHDIPRQRMLEARDRSSAPIHSSGLIHSDDSQIGRSSPSSHYESRNCRQRHASRSPPA
jgi:hypothetical protein